MAEKETWINELTNYGLTPLEAKVYISLIRLGRSSANQVAKAAKIIRAEVYRVVRELIKKEIVTEHLGRPILFEAIHPSKMLEILTRQLEMKADNLRQKQSELSSGLISIIGEREEVPVHEHFEMIMPTRRFEKYLELFSSVEEELIFAAKGTDILEAIQSGLSKIIFKLVKKVRIRGIVEVDRDNQAVASTLERLRNVSDQIEIRHIKIGFNYVIFDRKELLFGTGFTSSTGSLWTNNQSFVTALEESFDQHWQLAKVEEALLESEAKYRALVESSPNLVGIVQDGILKYGNRALCEQLGWTFEEMISPHFNFLEEIIPKRFQTLVKNNLAKRLRGENIAPYELSLKKRDGSEITVLVCNQIVNYQGKPAEEIVLVDITERKKMEEDLRESEAKCRGILESSPDAIAVTDLNGKIIECNQAALALYGAHTKAELVGKDAFDVIARKDRQKALENMKRALKEGTVKNLEFIFLTKDGSEYSVEVSVNVLRDTFHKPQAFVAIIKNITERKRLERELRESEEKLRQVFQSVNDGIVVTDFNGVITDINEKVLQLGRFVSKNDIVGKNALETIVSQDRERALADMLKLAKQGSIGKREYTLLRADGSQYPAEINASVIKNIAGKSIGFVSVIRDITEPKRRR